MVVTVSVEVVVAAPQLHANGRSARSHCVRSAKYSRSKRPYHFSHIRKRRLPPGERGSKARFSLRYSGGVVTVTVVTVVAVLHSEIYQRGTYVVVVRYCVTRRDVTPRSGQIMSSSPCLRISFLQE